MDSIWNDPSLRPALLALLIAGSGALTVVITRIGVKLGQLIDELKVTRTELSLVAITTTKTETLVNSQRSELRAEIENLKMRLDASQLAATVAAETASKIAVQTAKDMAVHLATNVALTTEIEKATTRSALAPPQAIPDAGGLSVTIPETVLPVEDAPPSRIVRP